MRRTRCSARGGRGLWLTLLVVALTLGPGARAAAAGAGYWHTSGNQILDANGEVVRIAGINWYGFETTDKVIHGLWCQDWHNIVNTIKSLGYNVVRMPFSDDMVSFPIAPTNIGASNGAGPMNRDVIGLDSLTIMDRVIQTLGDVGIRVILDNHRSTAGNSAQENGLWYTPEFSEQTLIDNWITLVRRYRDFRDPQGNPIVIGADLRNEPHLNVAGAPTGACWTGDTATGGCPVTSARNWPKAAERIGNAILAENPNLLVIVEGAECYDGDCDWWGGNLQGVATHPVVLNVPNRLVYSAHDYGPNLYRQKWFTSSTTCDSLAAVWDEYWGYISRDGIAPVLVGEFGANNGDYTGTAPGSQGQWFQCLVQYIKARPHMHWTYWALNGEDDYGLLGAQYEPTLPSPGKHALLAPMQFPLEGGGGLSCATPNIPTSFTATAVSANRVDLKWSAVPSPGAGCAVTYDVFRSTNGTGMTPSAANRIATGVTGTSYSDTTVVGNTTYYYLVEAVDITVASPPSSKTSATTPQGGGTAYALTVTRSGVASGGTVASTPAGIQCGTTCSATYAAGTVVTLTATPASGYVFTGWSGPCTGSAATCVVTMSAAQSVGATFLACAAPASMLTVTRAGTGAGTVTSSPAGISCGTTCTMTVSSCGAVPGVVLTATPAAGSAFTGWSGACTGTGATCSVQLTGNVAVTANFTLGTSYTLSVTRSGPGNGTVTSSPGGIDCGAACAASYASGTTVTLTATALAGVFSGWAGACTGTGTCTLSMTADRAVMASFASCANGYVTLTKSGTGTGTVTSNNGTLSCGTACTGSTGNFACASTLTLTATPAAGSRFAGWSGDCTGTAPTCTVAAGFPRITATFELAPSYLLTVTRAGTGAGTVTSRPAGIDCGATCSAAFPSGTAVTLTATAAVGSSFGGWSGACTGTATCVVSMAAIRSVTANFSQNPCARWVPVRKLGTGTGTVRSSDGKIDCGATCEAILSCSESLTLTATAAPGSRFAGWGGTCSGTGACTANGGEVTATFELGDATPCANPITFTNNTGNFNTTGAVCYRTAQRVNGWGCSNFSGRTISVNAGTATASCGAGPFPLAQVGGYTYFSATAGSFPWASIYVW